MSRGWSDLMIEPARLALESLREQRTRSLLAIGGIVVGIVTVVITASVLVNARNQVALLFRDLGTDNVFAFHLTGDPYVTPIGPACAICPRMRCPQRAAAPAGRTLTVNEMQKTISPYPFLGG